MSYSNETTATFTIENVTIEVEFDGCNYTITDATIEGVIVDDEEALDAAGVEDVHEFMHEAQA